MGRPTKLTDELQERICRLIATGSTFEQASKLSGISSRAFHLWRARGRAAKTGKFFRFVQAVKEAEEQFIRTHLDVIVRASTEASVETRELIRQAPDGTEQREIKRITRPPVWQPSAWLLERKFPHLFSLRQRIEHSGAISSVSKEDLKELGQGYMAAARGDDPEEE